MSGPELRKIRLRLKLRQVDLAESIGVAANTVARWERSEMRITEPMSRLIRLVTGPRPKARRAGR